jgi:hypothetical protein
MRHGNEKIGGRAVFPTFAMLRMNSLLGVSGGTLRSAIVKALGPGDSEQLTPDHDGVLKQIFCISDSGVDTGSVTSLPVVIVCSIFIWPELAVAVHGPQHPKATNDSTAE